MLSTLMPDDPYSAHADVIEDALASVRTFNRLNTDEADQFWSWARLRLIDNDFAILRQGEGRRLRTFLMTVVQRLFLDWRNANLGQWRPSPEARRLGVLGINLERLVIRDQRSFNDEVEILLAHRVADSRTACEAAWAKLRGRPASE